MDDEWIRPTHSHTDKADTQTNKQAVRAVVIAQHCTALHSTAASEHEHWLHTHTPFPAPLLALGSSSCCTRVVLLDGGRACSWSCMCTRRVVGKEHERVVADAAVAHVTASATATTAAAHALDDVRFRARSSARKASLCPQAALQLERGGCTECMRLSTICIQEG